MLAVVAEILVPSSLVTACLRPYFTILQGAWWIQVRGGAVVPNGMTLKPKPPMQQCYRSAAAIAPLPLLPCWDVFTTGSHKEMGPIPSSTVRHLRVPWRYQNLGPILLLHHSLITRLPTRCTPPHRPTTPTTWVVK